jgi:hypothetical protein
MPHKPVQSIMDDPLAGCLAFVQNEWNGNNLLRSLLMRLRLFYNEATCTAITDQIIAESGLVRINTWEYIINEVLYEFRLCQKEYNPAFETILLSNWTKDLYKRHHEDVVLAFFRQVKTGREKRIR